MPYRCQICKDCSDTEGFYQSDRDYPSDGSDSESKYVYRGGRWRLRLHRRPRSPRYRHYRRSERGGYGNRSGTEGHRESSWRPDGHRGGRTYRRRNSRARGTRNEDRYSGEAQGGSYERNTRVSCNSGSDGDGYVKREFSRERKSYERGSRYASTSLNENYLKNKADANEQSKDYNSGSDFGDQKPDSVKKRNDANGSRSASSCDSDSGSSVQDQLSNQKDDKGEHVQSQSQNVLFKFSDWKKKLSQAFSPDNDPKTKEIDTEDKPTQDSENDLLEASKQKLQVSEEKLETSEQKLQVSEQKLETSEQKLETSEHKLQVSEEKLETSEQKLQVSEQKLETSEQKLETSEQKLQVSEQKLETSEQKLETSEHKLQVSEEKLETSVQKLQASEEKLETSEEKEEGRIGVIKQEEESESSCTSDSDSFWDCSSDSESESDTGLESEENVNEEKDYAQNSERVKRAVNYKQRKQGGKRESHKNDGHAKPKGGRSRRKRSLHVSYVKMPTGKKYAISTPKPDNFQCGTLTKRIELHPNGKVSGYEYKIVEREMKNTIVVHQDCKRAGGCFKTYEIVKIEKLINGCLWKRYRHMQQDIFDEHHYVNQKMLFHGSAKVDDIANTGFDERYSNFNGMFGAGMYFTKHSSKANQYAFGYMGGNGCPNHSDKDCHTCERKLLLCRVTLGRSKNIKKASVQAHSPPGYNSVVGVPSRVKGGLRYHEAIVYRGEQVYPEYVITYKIKD